MDVISDGDLDEIERWAAHALDLHAKANAEGPYHDVCAYNALLPTHSIRSQMLQLVEEVRRQRALLQTGREPAR